MPLTTRAGMSALFGDPFADAVFAGADDGWFGPVATVFGEHLIEITDVAALKSADFEEVREQVRNDFIGARRAEQRRKDEQRMVERYDVRIEWPKEKAETAK